MGMSSFDQRSDAFRENHEDPWYVDTDEEEEDDFEDDDDQQLTLLVRKSYLTHLTRCLKKNYDEFRDPNESLPPDKVAKLLTFHAKYLEKKALRASMRVGIYQRCMIQQIDEIKKASKQNQIHPTFSARRPKMREYSEKETQTEKPPKTELQMSLTNAFGLSPGYHGGDDQEQYDELLNILTATQMTPSHSVEMETEYDTSMLGQSIDSYTPANTTREEESFLSHQEPSTSPTRRMNLDERLKQLGLMFEDEETDAGQTLPLTEEQLPPVADEEPQNIVDPLESTMEFPVPCTSSIVEPALKRHSRISPADWTQELTIQADLLQAVLDRKSPLMRTIIERRFRDLFGIDQPPELVEIPSEVPSTQYYEYQPSPQLETSQDGFVELRRTAAGYVVNALTPYFLKRRIASRQVFKYLAKRVTDRLLSRTLTPDPALAKKETKICFAIKPNMMSMADVDEVFWILNSS